MSAIEFLNLLCYRRDKQAEDIKQNDEWIKNH